MSVKALAVAAGAAIALALTARAEIVLPRFEMVVTLSKAMAARLEKTDGRLMISVYHYAEPRPGSPENLMGHYELGFQKVDLPVDGKITLGGLKVSDETLALIAGPPQLSTGPHALFADGSADIIADCDGFEGDAAAVPARVEVLCKRADE